MSNSLDQDLIWQRLSADDKSDQYMFIVADKGLRNDEKKSLAPTILLRHSLCMVDEI